MKTNKLLLALMMAASMMSSCVKDEKSPLSDAGIDAKLPYPTKDHKLGDEIVIKGSGFTASDRVFVQAVVDEIEEDYDQNYDGKLEVIELTPQVEARIANVNDRELTFIVPAAMDTVYSSYEVINVYLNRNNQNHKLGYFDYYNTNRIRADLSSQYTNTMTLYNVVATDKVYLSYLLKDPDTQRFIPVGELYPVEITSSDEYISEGVCKAAIGDMVPVQIINGEMEIGAYLSTGSEPETIYFNPSYLIQLDEQTFYPNYYLKWNGFLGTDRIILRSQETGSSQEAEIIRKDEQGILLKQPKDKGLYNLYLKRSDNIEINLKHIINNQ